MTSRIAPFLIAVSLGLGNAAWATAPTTSLRPDARPTSVAPSAPAQSGFLRGLRISPFPKLRPKPAATPETPPVTPAAPNTPVVQPETETATLRIVPASPGTSVARSPRPDLRPRNFGRIVRAAVRSQPATAVATSKRGSVCGDPSIRGQAMSRIPGRIRGCGIANPVQVTAVDGVTLTQAATINCETARALKKWVSRSVKPAVGRMGGGVKSLRVVAHYSCRTRNNIPGAKVSEHGRGNAIDIAAINLNNGASLSVLRGWRDKAAGPVLKKVHAGACGTFGTVLGPNSDRYHQDHFHFDVARHRGGAYCR